MAKVHIPPGVSPEETARELASIGVTMGQRLQDGTYRAYVRKDKKQLFFNYLNLLHYGQETDH